MGPSKHGLRNEPLPRDDEDDEYDENPKGILSLLEENARLRRVWKTTPHEPEECSRARLAANATLAATVTYPVWSK
jgi:hypothetical protein